MAQGCANITYYPCDISSEVEVAQFAQQIQQIFPRVDVLIHCAATIGPVGSILDVTASSWQDAVSTNLYGSFLVCKYMIPMMHAEYRPRILLLAGGGSFDPMPHLSAYGIAKAGIVRLVETLAIELSAKNIAVNNFAPGFVPTPIFDDLIAAGPEQGGQLYTIVTKLLAEWDSCKLDRVIACLKFLISEAAAPLTGKTISANHDPWDTPEFANSLEDIVASSLYTTCRVDGKFRYIPRGFAETRS